MCFTLSTVDMLYMFLLMAKVFVASGLKFGMKFACELAVTSILGKLSCTRCLINMNSLVLIIVHACALHFLSAYSCRYTQYISACKLQLCRELSQHTQDPRMNVLHVLQESEYAAWTLVNGYNLNHAAVSVHRLTGLE